jgi:hypothetical protein
MNDGELNIAKREQAQCPMIRKRMRRGPLISHRAGEEVLVRCAWSARGLEQDATITVGVTLQILDALVKFSVMRVGWFKGREG